jgi:hypothetical protein
MSMLTRTKRRLGTALLMVVLVITTVAGNIGRAQGERSEKGKKGLQVTILLYSGRTNPSFILDDEASINMMKDQVGSSKGREAFKKETVIPSILGYNGVVVENIDRMVEQFPVSLIIYKGIMEVMNDGKKFLNDEGNKIENFLLNKAVEKKVIEENVLQKIIKGK